MASIGIPFQFIVQSIVQGINPDVGVVPNTGVWRPVQWNQPALTSITIPAQPPDPTTGLAVPAEILVFDAILRAEHHQELRRTEHPVQTGANITDHAYRLPARLTLEIGMSDAMDSFYPGFWSGDVSKSVSAYGTLVNLIVNKSLVSITTRLATYSNMLCESVQSPDTNTTRYGLRVTAVFSELMFASITTSSPTKTTSQSWINYNMQPVDGSTDMVGDATNYSVRPQDTQATSIGSVQGQSPSNVITNQHQVAQPTTVPNAGSWSSNTVLGLPEASQLAPAP